MIRDQELENLRVRREALAAKYRSACLRLDTRKANELRKEQADLVLEILKKENKK